MSRAAWILRRLGAMGPGEIAHRTRTAFTDRFAPTAWATVAPDAAFAHFFPGGIASAVGGSRLAGLVRLPEDEAAFAPAAAAARDLLAGRWSCFGRDVVLDDPPRWRRDPLTGYEWPDGPSRRIEYRDQGAKGVWELGRLTMLPTLALAARLRGDRACADRAVRWLADFTRGNPLDRGIHHTSGIEMAIRVMTASWTLALLPAPDVDERLCGALGLIQQQAHHCRTHLSLGSSANNHLIAEYAAMTVAGSLFPGARGAGRLLDLGLAGLERETLRQFHADGVNAEQSFGYVPFVWELLLVAFAAAEAAGRAVPATVRERLSRSLEFARAVRLPDGRMPQVGDEDDGRVLLALESPTRLDLVGSALAAWLGAPAPAEAPALALLLWGRAPASAAAAPEGAHEYPEGGYTVWRSQGLVATFDHGPLGLAPMAAHGHADALAITLYDGATPVVCDPGTFAYHEDAGARDRCRGTPGHATLHFGGRSQSRMLGPFLWGDRAQVSREGDRWLCRWAGGERHARRAGLEGPAMVLEDEAHGGQATLDFTLAPGAEVVLDGARARVRTGSTRATFEVEGAGTWRLERGECAPRFAQVAEAPRLSAALTGTRARTVIRIER